MKALLLIPRAYPLSEMIADGFVDNGWEAIVLDYRDIISHHLNRFYDKTSGFPRKLTNSWKSYYYGLANKGYMNVFEKVKPDIVLIYNNQFIFPQIIHKMKKYSSIVFFLGDSPLWSKTFEYNLAILNLADLVLSPDSHWKFELNMMGVPNLVCDYIGYSRKHFFPVSNIPEELHKKYDSDLLFIGRNYNDSSGYKRAMFLNSFTGMNIKIYGTKEWKRWLPYFPDMKRHFNILPKRISHEELNYAINSTKIYPIDQNTGIVNGIHLRVFETIGAGTLPLVEWRKDIDDVFGSLIPVIKNYNESKELAEHYLNYDSMRNETVFALRKHLDTHYNPAVFIKRLLQRL